jgi:hypothetical protein
MRGAPVVWLCLALGLGATPEARAHSVMLSCEGRLLRYSTDLTQLLETLNPHAFTVVVDFSARRLERAPVEEPERLRLRDAGDAVFFFRDRSISGLAALEWISINRFTGNYAHFIAFRDSDPEGVRSPVLMAAAECKVIR